MATPPSVVQHRLGGVQSQGANRGEGEAPGADQKHVVVTKTSFKVNGNCDMCKKRIEKAAKTEGVKKAVWNKDTHIMTVEFIPTKISVDQIEQNIANIGYDTEKHKASDAAYNSLPQCCQYTK